MTYNHVNGNMRCIYTGTGHQSISMYQKNKAAEESSKQKTESESSQKLEIEARFIFYENGARSSGNQEGAMDRTRGLPTGVLCGLVWRPSMGFHSQSFRFEGGGRQIIGLNRTGKSCRLRWVNYLHPGLKRGKMTPQEERLVLELHSKWGNRWSRIARKLPGRTDNEIKNYWRTHMRKKAQEKKRAVSPSSSSSNCSSSSNITTNEGGASFYDTGGVEIVASSAVKKNINGGDPEKEDNNNTTKRDQREYSLDDIWEDINLPEVNSIEPVYDGNYSEEACKFACPLMASPPPPLSWDSLFKMDEDQESKNMFLPATPNDNQFLSVFEDGRSSSLTG